MFDEAPPPGACFKLVDPDGLFAEPACDLAVPLREYSRELLDASDAAHSARERCAYLSRLTAVEPRAIWEWGFMERVSTGLLCLRVGRERLGDEMLFVAEKLVSPGRRADSCRPGRAASREVAAGGEARQTRA